MRTGAGDASVDERRELTRVDVDFVPARAVRGKGLPITGNDLKAAAIVGWLTHILCPVASAREKRPKIANATLLLECVASAGQWGEVKCWPHHQMIPFLKGFGFVAKRVLPITDDANQIALDVQGGRAVSYIASLD